MYIRWIPRKRNRPAFGRSGGDVMGEDGLPVFDRRGSFARQRRREDGTDAGQDVCWGAALVESVRIDGKPRQRHIAFLGSITDSAIEIPSQRRYFWDEVYEALDRLSNRIAVDDRRRLEAAIAMKVPRLTREEHAVSVAAGVSWGVGEQKPYREPA